MSKRLQKELKELADDPKPWLKVDLANGENLYQWKAEMTAPDNTPYEKGVYKLDIDIPTDYPFKPPKVKFATPIYHPNVKADGTFCLDILTTEGWSPQLKITKEVMETVRGLLLAPNPENPLEAEIAQLYKSDLATFNKNAREWTKKYAVKQ